MKPSIKHYHLTFGETGPFFRLTAKIQIGEDEITLKSDYHALTKSSVMELSEIQYLYDDREVRLGDVIKNLGEEEIHQIESAIIAELQTRLNNEEDFLDYHNTGFIPESAYKNIKLDWIDRTKYPILLKEFVDSTNETIELRKKDEKLKYCRVENDEIVRDEAGQATYLTEEEVISRELPLYDTHIVAFNSLGVPVGHVSDEFGADGVWVLPEYQRRGIGTELLFEFRKQFSPKRKIGQMTNAGTYLTRAYFRKLNSK